MVLTVGFKVTDRGALGSEFQSRLRLFLREVKRSQTDAATVATAVSKRSVHRLRPTVLRHSRSHGLRGALQWHADGASGVALDMAELSTKFPPWLIQEIGTGERAIQYEASPQGATTPVGRPAKNATHVKTVRSQVGRPIRYLVWATAGGAKYQHPGQATGQQLYFRSQVPDAPPRFDKAANRHQANIIIGREISGQHFIQQGGRAGFRTYRSSVLSAARTQLKRPK